MNIAVLLFHEVHELDAVGPYSALYAAKKFLDDPDDLNLYMVAKSRNSVQTSGNLVITPHWAFISAPEPEVLIVPGGRGVDAAMRDKALTMYLLQHAPKLRLLTSVCTGALILGRLGLIRDLRATTHSGSLERLRDYEVGDIVDERVVKNSLADDRGLWCAGGVSAGIDLGLELAQEFYGDNIARQAAEQINYPYWMAASEES